ncbi:MAG TPA: 2-dehydropantoate 2-reductase [Kribbellaceae bacterium]|nr:2-dehydropantoate 2-reductase [Kribbellaceae bacterium]
MKIAVIGAGGIGGYFGGRLAAAGHEVGFVARGAHLEALRRDGLTVRSVNGDFTVAPARATDEPRELGAAEVVMLAVKTWQLEQATALLAPLMGSGTAVLTTQNGVEAPQQVADVVGREAVLPGLAKIFASIEEPGVIRHVGGPASLAFAEWDGSPSDRVERLRTALVEAGVAATVPESVWTELWAKFLFVVPFGGLGAVTDAPIGVLRSAPGTRRLLEDAMREIRDVGQALGVKLPGDIVESTMAFVDQQPPEGRSSLQRDLLSGRPSELDAWNGAVARLGSGAGVATPIHALLYDVLTVLASTRRAG